MLDDTIAAVATPPGRGGIGVIRVSGASARDVVERIVRNPLWEPNRAFVRDVVSPDDGEAIDTAVITFFRAPRSFTGDDTVEISCHGSPVILGAVMNAVLRSGARHASPGEFTLRAFLNGRIDLTQAEAVRDLVDAQTTHQARSALRQSKGALARRLAPLKERLLHLVVQLESTVEFVEDDLEPHARETLAVEMRAAASDLAALAASFALGRKVSEGISLALVGPPNAGKSSLFNALLEAERAIVTAVPGTTRDLVSESLVLGGLPYRLIDTAGLREASDAVERIGIERTRSAMVDVDLVLVVVDAADTLPAEAASLLEETERLARIVVINKADVATPSAELRASLAGTDPLSVSALTGAGVAELRERLVISAGAGGLGLGDILVTNARHHALLAGASEHLERAAAALDEGLSEEFCLVGLHAALGELGELTGDTAVVEILDMIFSTFCIGK